MMSIKENVSPAAKLRNNLKDMLLKGLILSTNSEMDKNGDNLDLACNQILHIACLDTLFTTEKIW